MWRPGKKLYKVVPGEDTTYPRRNENANTFERSSLWKSMLTKRVCAMFAAVILSSFCAALFAAHFEGVLGRPSSGSYVNIPSYSKKIYATREIDPEIQTGMEIPYGSSLGVRLLEELFHTRGISPDHRGGEILIGLVCKSLLGAPIIIIAFMVLSQHQSFHVHCKELACLFLLLFVTFYVFYSVFVIETIFVAYHSRCLPARSHAGNFSFDENVAVLVMNLGREKERLKYMADQLDSLDVDWTRVAAADSRKYESFKSLVESEAAPYVAAEKNAMVKIDDFLPYYRRQMGKVALTASLIHAMHVGRRQGGNKTWLLIFEDDAAVPNDLKVQVEKIVRRNGEMDLINLDKRLAYYHLYHMPMACCTSGLLIRADAVSKLSRILLPHTVLGRRHVERYIPMFTRSMYSGGSSTDILYDWYLGDLCIELMCCANEPIIGEGGFKSSYR